MDGWMYDYINPLFTTDTIMSFSSSSYSGFSLASSSRTPYNEWR